MDCHEFETILPDHLQGGLSEDTRRGLEEHLQACAACRELFSVWQGLASLPDEQPSPRLNQRFNAMLEAYQRERQEREHHEATALPRPWWDLWLRSSFAPAAAAVVIFAAGLLVGLYVDRNSANATELAALRQELAGTRQLVALSMLQQQSASDRLQGVSWSRRIAEPDPEILAALLRTLRYDNSVDVRLAALDALRTNLAAPNVRSGIEDSLPHQQSPMVQIALVDLMVQMRDRTAIEKLRKFQKNPDLNPAVRQRLEWGISQLSRG